MEELDRLHLAMFSGKGGVGKTTIACGFARRWAQLFPQQKILLLSTDPAHSLGDVLQAEVTDQPIALADLPNLRVRSLSAEHLLQQFRAEHGDDLELLVERGSFVAGEDLQPVWDMGWPGLDELLGLLEIQRLLTQNEADRLVVDMAPSGHTLNLFGLSDFLDVLIDSLDLFQEKHRVVSQALAGKYQRDRVDQFLTQIRADHEAGKKLLQDREFTACLLVAIAEPMSLLESKRFLTRLQELDINCGGIFVNRLIGLEDESNSNQANQVDVIAIENNNAQESDRYAEQQQLLQRFLELAQGGQESESKNSSPIFTLPMQSQEPVGGDRLDQLIKQLRSLDQVAIPETINVQFPAKIPPGLPDFIANDRKLILIGGKGGVGKTTVAAAIGWAMAQKYPAQNIRLISIDPAHSLGDAFGKQLTHQPQNLSANLSAQEIDADLMLEQFRQDYLWELAEIISGQGESDGAVQIAYSPQAWRQIMAQALPGIDEMLALVQVIELLESQQQDLIILDTAPTGHLLRFLEMPAAMGDWLAWILRLWLKYQDIIGGVDLIGRLRNLRLQVVQTQKKLKDANHTEFIGVVQAQSAIVAEHARLVETLQAKGVAQNYIVHNRYVPGIELPQDFGTAQTIVRLPNLPRLVEPQTRVEGAARLLF
ncbi:arsenite efflux ATP-binding protein ArsA [Thalassoporum mexicanum PCC 7367]|uniref:ArsA family ATPase n=1 Tax=Thalassoporum mexicanum TaxID=3457544 RepID=UPI00029F95BF|nr:ArsA family ATPase [Pseudanabaena sp. PCC 7367]AFY68579.1 arsenite efflux ATP-binding protein ArsA [Pseudanabaena sp. PCC 7367]